MDSIQLSMADLAEVFGQQKDAFWASLAELGEDGNPMDVTPEIAAAKIPQLLKAEKERYLNEGKRIGARTRMSEFEEKLREKYNITARTEGEALVNAIVDGYTQQLSTLQAELENAKKAGGKKGEMTDEEAKAFIANHPFFEQAISEKKAEAERIAAEFAAYKEAEETRKTTDFVGANALEALSAFNPVETDDDTINRNLRATYQAAVLSGAGFKVVDGRIEVVDRSTGEPLKDENYRNLTFEQYAAGVAKKFYKQHPADPSKGAPKNGGNGGGSAGVNIPDWTKMGRDEIFAHVLKETDPAKRKVLSDSAQQFLK